MKHILNNDIFRTATIVLVIIMCAATFSCNSSHVGKYVYIETWRNGYRLHIDRHCSNFNKNSEVAYIDTCDLQNSQSFCPKCVSDIDAGRIKAIIERRSNRKIKNLYEELKKEGYKLDDEEIFRNSIRNDASYRRDIYRTLIDNNYDMEGFSDFENNVGVNK